MAKKRMFDVDAKHQQMATDAGRGASADFLCLAMMGDTLAEREEYPTVRGTDAVVLYLAKTHHWKLSEVRAMTWEDMLFMLEGEKL